MPRREAEGLCPDAVVLMRDHGEEARRFEPVALLLEEVIPQIEVAEPGLIFVPLAGALDYYGGEEQIVEIIDGKLREIDARIGVADGPFASTWAARAAEPGEPYIVEDTRAFLAELDVSALDHEDLVSTFRWLGVTTLGALADLPRPAIASRFGDLGLAAHRLARGEDRTVDPRRIPPELAVEAIYEEPLELLDQVAFAARALAAKLMAGLRREGIAPHRIVVEAESSTGEVRTRVWRSADPFTEQVLADRVWWQLRAWVENSGREVAGVVRLRLDPSDLSGDGRQLGFFTDETARVEAERALARAQALVGHDAVLQAVPQGGRLPGEQVAWYRWGEEPTRERDPAAPWPGATPMPSPALVPPEPRLLEVEWEQGIPTRIRLGSRWEPVHTWSGPWRMSPGWWKGEVPRDRYQLVTSVGAILCLVEDGRTFLAGVYD